MRARVRLIGSGIALAVVCSLASACGSGAIAADAPTPCDATEIKVPATLTGLNVVADAKSTKKITAYIGTKSYVRDARVFALRIGTGKDARLQAVFQIVRLTADAHPEDVTFRKKIVNLVGGGTGTPTPILGQLVYSAAGVQQAISVWFQDCFMETLYIPTDPNVPVANRDQILLDALKLKPAKR
jgi:hypothetical protein